MITEEEILAIRENTDLAALVSEAGAIAGDDGNRRCPFCSVDKFRVNGKRGFFHCFGCKAAGSAIDFVSMWLGVGFLDAVNWLKNRPRQSP